MTFTPNSKGIHMHIIKQKRYKYDVINTILNLQHSCVLRTCDWKISDSMELSPYVSSVPQIVRHLHSECCGWAMTEPIHSELTSFELFGYSYLPARCIRDCTKYDLAPSYWALL